MTELKPPVPAHNVTYWYIFARVIAGGDKGKLPRTLRLVGSLVFNVGEFSMCNRDERRIDEDPQLQGTKKLYFTDQRSGSIKRIRTRPRVPRGCSMPRRVCTKCQTTVIHKNSKRWVTRTCQQCAQKGS